VPVSLVAVAPGVLAVPPPVTALFADTFARFDRCDVRVRAGCGELVFARPRGGGAGGEAARAAGDVRALGVAEAREHELGAAGVLDDDLVVDRFALVRAQLNLREGARADPLELFDSHAGSGGGRGRRASVAAVCAQLGCRGARTGRITRRMSAPVRLGGGRVRARVRADLGIGDHHGDQRASEEENAQSERRECAPQSAERCVVSS